MTANELIVASEEQSLALLNGYSATLMFDPYYKRWYYNLYKDSELVFAGVPLDPDTAALLGMSAYSLGLVDKVGTKEFYEPYVELGSRLGLVEIIQ